MKLSRYKIYINTAEITEILLSSIATTTTSKLFALTGVRNSIPTAFYSNCLWFIIKNNKHQNKKIKLKITRKCIF